MANENEISELRKKVDLKSISIEEKMTYVSNLIVDYPRFSEVIEKIEYCRKTSKVSSEPENFFIGGPTGAGKTTVCDEYVKNGSGELRQIPKDETEFDLSGWGASSKAEEPQKRHNKKSADSTATKEGNHGR